MNSTTPYPVFLSLKGRRCAVVGLGSVGCRKLSGLLGAGVASILALERRELTKLSPEARDLVRQPPVHFETRAFAEADARSCFLVFAATSSAVENMRIVRLCRQERALCNCITEPSEGDFILPATAYQGRLCAAISTSGQSPFLARQWRLELEDWLKPRERLAWLMGRLRGPILALGNEQAHNSMIFRRIAASSLPYWLERGDIEKCREWLQSELPPELHEELALVFAEYADVFA